MNLINEYVTLTLETLNSNGLNQPLVEEYMN